MLVKVNFIFISRQFWVFESTFAIFFVQFILNATPHKDRSAALCGIALISV